MSGELKEISWDEAIELGSPYPYVLAVTIDKNERANIIGLGWWTIVSWNPRMIAISIGKGRYSRECVEHCKEFVLCFPSSMQKKEAWMCGTKSGKNTDKSKETGLKLIPAKVVAPPLIDGSVVAYECKVVKTLEVGDHFLYVGTIVASHGTPDRPQHLYSIHYKKLISLDYQGNIDIS